MARKSSIKQLPEEIQDAVNEAIREGATIDAIVETIRAMGAEASRSAVGRYKKDFEDVARQMRQAQDIAKVWMESAAKAPEGELGLLVGEMIRTMAWKVTSDMLDAGEEVKPQDVMLLGKAMQHVSSSDKILAERFVKLRREFADKLDDALSEAEAAGEKGLSAERVAQLRRDFLGVR